MKNILFAILVSSFCVAFAKGDELFPEPKYGDLSEDFISSIRPKHDRLIKLLDKISNAKPSRQLSFWVTKLEVINAKLNKVETSKTQESLLDVVPNISEIFLVNNMQVKIKNAEIEGIEEQGLFEDATAIWQTLLAL